MLQIRPCPSTLNWKADKPSSHTVDVFNLIHNIGGDCPWTGSGMQVSFFPSNTAIMLEVIKPPTSLKTSIPPFTNKKSMIKALDDGKSNVIKIRSSIRSHSHVSL